MKIGNGQQAVDNTKKIKLIVCAVCALLLIPCSSVPAQQPKKVPQIGFLMGGYSGNDSRVEAFRQGLHDLGYVEGKNIAIEWRFAEGQEARVAPLVAELIHMRVDPS